MGGIFTPAGNRELCGVRLALPPRDRRKSRPRLEIVEIIAVAHVLFEASRNGWKSQGRLALGERGVDEPAPALALAHLGVERGEVPASRDLGAKVGDVLGILGRRGEIVALARIAASRS